MTRYQFFSYHSSDGSAIKPALLAWYSSPACVIGLGISPGEELFDPRPFAAAFPSDVDRAWMFAEWATALAEMLRAGAKSEEVLRWVNDAHPRILSVVETGVAESPAALVKRLPDEPLVEAMAEAVLVEVFRALGGTPVPVRHGAMPAADFIVEDEHGGEVWVEIKKATRSRLPSATLSRPDGGRHLKVAVDDSQLLLRLQSWLRSSGRPRRMH
jgi:hypothetical protein